MTATKPQVASAGIAMSPRASTASSYSRCCASSSLIRASRSSRAVACVRHVDLEVAGAIGLDPVGDVGLDPDVVGDPAGLVDDRADHHLVPERGAVAPVVAQDRGHGAPLGEGRADARHRDRVGVRTLQEPAVATEDLLRRVAGEPGERAVHPDERVVVAERVGDREREVAAEDRVQRQVVLPSDHLVVAAHTETSVACTAGTRRDAEPYSAANPAYATASTRNSPRE